MKYYSEILNQLFDSQTALYEAEKAKAEAEEKKKAEEKAKKEERALRAKEVEKALKEANEAQAKAIQLLKNFTKDYGYFHMSYSTDDANKADEKKVKFSNTTDTFLNLLECFLQ